METKSVITSSLIILAVGILLLFLQSTALSIVILVMGLLLIAAAGIGFYFDYSGAKQAGQSVSVFSMISLIVSLAAGLWMVFAPASAASLLVYVIAIGLILGGVLHIANMMTGFGPIRLPGYFYIVPLLLVICGIVVLIIGADRTKDCIVLICGISLIVYAVSTLLEVASYKRLLKQ